MISLLVYPKELQKQILNYISFTPIDTWVYSVNFSFIILSMGSLNLTNEKNIIIIIMIYFS